MKKVFSIVLTFAILLSLMPLSTFAATGPVIAATTPQTLNIVKTPTTGNILLGQTQTDITTYVGGSFYLDQYFYLYREGNQNIHLNLGDYMSNITVTITPSDDSIISKIYGFTINGIAVGTAKIAVDYNGQTINFNVTVNEPQSCTLNLAYASPVYQNIQVNQKQSYGWGYVSYNTSRPTNTQIKVTAPSGIQNYLYILTDNNRLFYGKLNATEITVSDADQHKLTYTQVPGLTIYNTTVLFEPDKDGVKAEAFLTGNEMSMPAGSYGILVSYAINGVKHVYYTTVDLSSDKAIDLSQVTQTKTIAATWSNVYEDTAINISISPAISSGTSSMTFSLNFPSYTKGEKIYVSDGYNYSINVPLVSQGISYPVSGGTSVSGATDVVINIGDTFTGTFLYSGNSSSQSQVTATAGSTIYLNLNQCSDSNYKYLYSFNSNDGTSKASGVLTLTNINNSADVITLPFETNYSYGINVTLPDIEGSYSGRLIINGTSIDIQTYTINAIASVGGTVTGAGTYYANASVVLNAIPNPGYAFDAWYVSNNKYSTSTSLYIPATAATAAMTYEARFIAVASKFNVTFNTNGGSTISTLSLPINSLITRPDNPIKSGYVFGGWYKDSALNNPWLFDTDKVVGDTTLYANWIPVPTDGSFIVVIDTFNGSKVTYLGAANVGTLADPTRAGYTFAGWYTDPNYINKWNSAAPITGNMTLYAKWNIVQANAPVTVVTPSTIAPVIPIGDPFVRIGDSTQGTQAANSSNTTSAPKVKMIKNAVIYASDKTINVGDTFNLMDNVTAKDNGGKGASLTGKVSVSGQISTGKAGIYQITYKVVGENGKAVTKTIKVTVTEKVIVEAVKCDPASG